MANYEDIAMVLLGFLIGVLVGEAVGKTERN